jgi:hypothetical protein
LSAKGLGRSLAERRRQLGDLPPERVALGAAGDVRVEDRELELRERAVDLDRGGHARTFAG